jgi:hypothetical protein
MMGLDRRIVERRSLPGTSSSVLSLERLDDLADLGEGSIEVDKVGEEVRVKGERLAGDGLGSFDDLDLERVCKIQRRLAISFHDGLERNGDLEAIVNKERVSLSVKKSRSRTRPRLNRIAADLDTLSFVLSSEDGLLDRLDPLVSTRLGIGEKVVASTGRKQLDAELVVLGRAFKRIL